MTTVVKQDSIFVRIDYDDKKEVESICRDMGITPASAAKMFFKQLIKERALPFSPKASDLPWALQEHSEEEIVQGLLEAEKDIKNGNVYSEKEFKKMIDA